MSEITGNILSNKILDGSITTGPIIAGDYIIYMSSIDGGNRLYVTKGSVTNHIDILDGDKGDKGDKGNKGDDGFSPYITITPIENGTRVTITDANGDHVFNVLDGIGDVNSVNGEKGDIVITPEKIGAIPNTVTIPEKITDLQNDANYISKDDNDISSDSTWSSNKINQTKQDIITDLENIRNKAMNAAQMSDLSTVGKTGKYSDLLNKPNIPDELKDLQDDYFHQTVSQTQINSWDSKQNSISDLNSIRSGASAGATAVQPNDLAPVATSGSYDDLTDKPDPILPEGGTVGQVLTKTETGTEWADPQGGGGGAVNSVNGKTGRVVLDAEDVGALPDTTTIPETIAELTDDALHRTVTDTEKTTWNSKADSSDIPDSISDLTEDNLHRTVTDAEKAAWSAKQEAGNYALASDVTAEATARSSADTALQGQIDAIASKSDVVDVVGTYAELQAYDTSELLENDVIKVLSDNMHDDGRSYYRWANDDWDYIGTESIGYTKSETDQLLNGKYSKPSGGIPKTDLTSEVQTSLGLADSALQEHQSLAGYATETYVGQQIAAAIGDAIGGEY